LVGEAGIEPALMLVTPDRLRNAKVKESAPERGSIEPQHVRNFRPLKAN
jgi:hypothetical protein